MLKKKILRCYVAKQKNEVEEGGEGTSDKLEDGWYSTWRLFLAEVRAETH